MQMIPDDDYIGVTDEVSEIPIMGGEVDEDELYGAALLMGYDIDMLGASAFRKRLRAAVRRVGKRVRSRFRKVGAKIRQRIAARRGGKGGSVLDDFSAQIQTPRGTATLGPEGIDFTDTQAQAPATSPAPGGIMATIQRNPLLIAIPAGALVLLLMARRR